MIEFIGSGISSRALIRKGQLRYAERRSAEGHVFRLLTETGAPLTADSGVTMWVDGHSYHPDPECGLDGGAEIVVPYSKSPGQVPLILTVPESNNSGDGWTFSSLHQFNRYSESYSLDTDFYVDRYVCSFASCSRLVRLQLDVL